MKIKDYFGSFKKNNYNNLNKYMSIFNKELSDYYNFGNAFFKGKYHLNYEIRKRMILGYILKPIFDTLAFENEKFRK